MTESKTLLQRLWAGLRRELDHSESKAVNGSSRTIDIVETDRIWKVCELALHHGSADLKIIEGIEAIIKLLPNENLEAITTKKVPLFTNFDIKSVRY